jgi:Rieske Fe-S protein
MTPNIRPLAPHTIVPERRAFFQRLARWVTVGVAGLAALILGVPLVGFFLGAVRKKQQDQWVPLGNVGSFPPGETRRTTFDNPIRQPWDGIVAHTGVYVRHEAGTSLAVQVLKDWRGLRLTEVVEGSTAAEAGLRAGDVLTKLDGSSLPDEAALTSVLVARQPGQVVVLTRRRAGQEDEVKVALDLRFLVLAVNCAHLGCPVEWFQESGLFMCPCHGGVYYANGERASGPPPRGLFHCVWRVRGGDLEVQAPHYPTLHNPLVQRVALPVIEKRA